MLFFNNTKKIKNSLKIRFSRVVIVLTKPCLVFIFLLIPLRFFLFLAKTDTKKPAVEVDMLESADVFWEIGQAGTTNREAYFVKWLTVLSALWLSVLPMPLDICLTALLSTI